MELHLETVALFSLKLAYESEDSSPILRDDLVMGDYQRDVFELLVRRGDVKAIQGKVDECLDLALNTIGGAGTVLGCELHKLKNVFSAAQTIEQLDAPLIALKHYLKDIY
jgi:hypothetical protein